MSESRQTRQACSHFMFFFFSPQTINKGRVSFTEYHRLGSNASFFGARCKNLCLQMLVLYRRHHRTTGKPESFHDFFFLYTSSEYKTFLPCTSFDGHAAYGNCKKKKHEH